MSRRQYYFDHAATTPLDNKVLKAMLPFLKEKYGNSSNLYALGREAKNAITQSTEVITEILNCRPDEFIYTASATESDNLTILGVARANKEKGNRIIISQVEHKGIIAVCQALRKEGFEIVELPVEKNGLIKLSTLNEALNEKTILVSVTYADSETGTIQPIKKISKIVAKFRARKNIRLNNSNPDIHLPTSLPYFHTDASQASAYLDINVDHLGVDLMTLSAHKLGGPKGIGGLYIRRGVRIDPIIYGGGQQSRLRSGTENVPAIVGFAEAMLLNEKSKKSRIAKVKIMRDSLEKGLFKSIPKITLNGHPTKRLPNYLNISILDIEGEAILLHLDELGIMVNTGSACNSQSLEPSSVLTAIGNPYEYIHGSIRFTLGKENSMSDVNYVLKYLPTIVQKLRAISPLELKLSNDNNNNKNSHLKTKNTTSNPKAFIGGQTPHFLRNKK